MYIITKDQEKNYSFFYEEGQNAQPESGGNLNSNDNIIPSN